MLLGRKPIGAQPYLATRSWRKLTGGKDRRTRLASDGDRESACARLSARPRWEDREMLEHEANDRAWGQTTVNAYTEAGVGGGRRDRLVSTKLSRQLSHRETKKARRSSSFWSPRPVSIRSRRVQSLNWPSRASSSVLVSAEEAMSGVQKV